MSRPRWGHRPADVTPRRSLLHRIRTVFLLWGIVNTGIALLTLAVVSSGAGVTKAGLGVCLVGLCVYWTVGWRRERFNPWLEPMEWMMPIAMGLFVTSIGDNGVFFAILLFRSFYGTRRDLLIRIGFAELVPLSALVAHQAYGRPVTVPYLVIPALLGAIIPLLMYFLRTVAEQNDRSVIRARVLLTGAMEIVAATDRRTIYESAVRTARALAGDQGDVRALLTVGDSGPLRLVAGVGPQGLDAFDGQPVPMDKAPADLRARLDGMVPFYLDADDAGRLRAAFGLAFLPGGLLVIPMWVSGRPIGLLSISGDGRPPAENQVTLATWGAQVAQAIEGIALTEELVRRVYHDPLTDLPNRALMEQRVEECLAQGAETGRVAFLFLDLDGFKQVNDAYGHQAGDALLREVACRLMSCVRAGDTVGRLGGDEFGILLPAVDDFETARGVADQVIAAVRIPALVCGQTVEVGISIGIALSGADGPRTVRDLVRAGDLAMYHVKARRTGDWARYEPHMAGVN